MKLGTRTERAIPMVTLQAAEIFFGKGPGEELLCDWLISTLTVPWGSMWVVMVPGVYSVALVLTPGRPLTLAG